MLPKLPNGYWSVRGDEKGLKEMRMAGFSIIADGALRRKTDQQILDYLAKQGMVYTCFGGVFTHVGFTKS